MLNEMPLLLQIIWTRNSLPASCSGSVALVSQVQRNLQNARLISSLQSRNFSKGWAAEQHVGVRPIRMVQHIQGFSPELQISSFKYVEVLQNRRVHLRGSRPGTESTGRVAKCVRWGRQRERGSVKPFARRTLIRA